MLHSHGLDAFLFNLLDFLRIIRHKSITKLRRQERGPLGKRLHVRAYFMIQHLQIQKHECNAQEMLHYIQLMQYSVPLLGCTFHKALEVLREGESSFHR